jgi:crotonobetainyl-CoA:carnitine CoA-transferase CaiB-like acyl-CoA transferase
VGNSDIGASGPLSGVRVVELAMWAAGPVASAIMADWGADVIKIEPLQGDPYRALAIRPTGNRGANSNQFIFSNRGKRSITLDLRHSAARQIAYDLVKGADVFLTNIRQQGLAKFQMEYDNLRAFNPRLIYTHVTAYGLTGQDRNKAGYDNGAYWARSAVADTVLPPGAPPLFAAGGFGDVIAALSAVTGTCAALVARNTTNRGQLVSTSLMRAGSYQLSLNLFDVLRGQTRDRPDRNSAVNPVNNCYRCADGKWVWLLGLESDRHWPLLLKALGRDDLLDDSRFSSHRKRADNRIELIKIIDAEFIKRSLKQWEPILTREDVWYCPTQSLQDLVEDPQAQHAGCFMNLPTEEGPIQAPSPPCDFSDTPWKVRNGPPELGQHTEEVLLELGYAWEDIERFKEHKFIG